MLTREATERERGSRALGWVLLATGVFLGALLEPQTWLAGLLAGRGRTAAAATTSAADARAELATLSLALDGEAARAALARAAVSHLPGEAHGDGAGEVAGALVRHSPPGALAREAEPGSPAAAGGARARLAVAGAWTSDVGRPRGRIDVALESGTLMGMRAFTVKPPHARGWLWEWLLRRAAEREGLLCQRTHFVNLVVDGHDAGVVLIEEALGPELLAARGRPTGPIVRFEQEDVFRANLANPAHPDAPRLTCLACDAHDATHDGSPAGHVPHAIDTDDPVASLLGSVQGGLAAAQLAYLAGGDDEARVATPAAVQELLIEESGRAFERVFNVEAWARMHALASLFRAQAGSGLRATAFRVAGTDGPLEPILGASDAGRLGLVDPVPWTAFGAKSDLVDCAAYRAALFAALARMLQPEYVETLFAELSPELARHEAALAGEGLPAKQTAAAVRAELVHQQLMLAKVCRPHNAANFQASLHLVPGQEDPTGGTIEVEAWGTTQAPVLVTGFRFGNGAVVPAAEALVERPGGPGLRVGDGVVLAGDGLRSVFRFAADQRLATLRNVEQVKEAVRTQTEKDESVRLVVDALHRPLAAFEVEAARLSLRAVKPAWSRHGTGRPEQPSLAEALALHACLAWDPERGALRVRPGTWDVEGDLVVPAGLELAAGPGTTLRFARGALLFSTEALAFEGSAAEPIVLEPAPGADRFAGVVVLSAEERSLLRHVVVRSTEGIERGGWLQTGAVDFFRSDVTLEHCRFEGTVAEDALNVVSADVRLDGVTIQDTVSDAFDGDFVTGLVERSTFDRTGGDGVDFSGCDIDVRTSTFRDIGDKAISIGESGIARVAGCTVESAAIGLASKDGSRVAVEGLALERCKHYGLAAYVKKPVYAAPVIEAHGVVFGAMGLGACIAQTGSRLVLDGEPQAVTEIDVKALYAEGILGT